MSSNNTSMATSAPVDTSSSSSSGVAKASSESLSSVVSSTSSIAASSSSAIANTSPSTTVTSTDPATSTATSSSATLPTSSRENTPTPTIETTPVTVPTTHTATPTAAIAQPTSSTAPPVEPTATPAENESIAYSVIVSVVTVTPTNGIGPGQVITQYITSTQAITPKPSSASLTASSATASGTAGLTNAGGNNSGGKGIGSGGTIAIAVVVPIVAVAALIAAGLFFWRRRKQRKDAEDMRRKEVEEYGYNPNNDPTIPAVGSGGSDGPYEMREEEASGYRGWGTTAVASSGRKASTTLSHGQSGVGMSYSEGTSPTHAVSDTRSDKPLVEHQKEEAMGAMGPSAGGNRDINRGPSNASSSYSAANRSDGSGEAPGVYNNGAEQYFNQYGTANPYNDATPYGSPQNRAEVSGQPVIRDVSARRNTRIENPSHYPGQQSAGISQNF
ncbi:hypothetical protein DSL72_002615 [Monilinia vaccinii-corymbosi]|uniref:Uncharacterized protein n=1 Tax=Monilinia vaccinii-corymbosi TaxID=61207 RepID=A0A8A3PD65_9HELO|nr:hypothetical protein DSL72_002615 [Monilinia vaccinii-corymbosi]